MLINSIIKMKRNDNKSLYTKKYQEFGNHFEAYEV